MNREQLLAWCAEQIWCVRPTALGALVSALQNGRGPIEAAPPRARSVARPSGGRVGIIPLIGFIEYRPTILTWAFGGTTVIGVRQQLQELVTDDRVDAIVFDIASPGGTATGIGELADEIYLARQRKPLVALVNPQACSGAYWLGSMANEIWAIAGADVGSIGAYTLHEDWSGWLEKEGIKITAMTFGERKIEGASWEPLDTEARTHFQAQIDDIGRQFQAAVARGRGVTLATVRTHFGAGRVFTAKEALERRMIDDIQPVDVAFERAAYFGGRMAAQRDRDYLDATLALHRPPPD